ncbi:DUF4861 domain-containing protein [Acidicapsa ligni]|uniref:DUF4861 domain-containing protein n=1 Tax=Acidicapsa ligni TaxID=542300 RepID=UPI0021DFBFFD|nr:DUF4861 domain-containing protein [Acidicapsa ligni]
MMTISMLAGVNASYAQQLVLTNLLHETRTTEVIQLPLADVRKRVPNIEHMIAENARTHERLPTQIYPNADGVKPETLLIAVQLSKGETLTLDFVPADHEPSANPLVYGREALERKDDFAWENQYTTYRVYGPALEATGEITSGIDVWSKRVPNLVIDSFYKRDAEGSRTHNPSLSYHKDDGVGLDSYLVGPSRGCGGTGILSDGKLWVSNNYTHLRMLSSGPVRFAFELTYAPWIANGVEVTETKRITLDAGTHLNKIDSTFTFNGVSDIDAAGGLAVHAGAAFEQLADGNILSVWDTPQDPTADRIATGLVVIPGQHTTASQLSGNALISMHLHSGETLSYLAGSGWSKADMPTQQAWNIYLQQTLTQLQHPVVIRWTKDKKHP